MGVSSWIRGRGKSQRLNHLRGYHLDDGDYYSIMIRIIHHFDTLRKSIFVRIQIIPIIFVAYSVLSASQFMEFFVSPTSRLMFLETSIASCKVWVVSFLILIIIVTCANFVYWCRIIISMDGSVLFFFRSFCQTRKTSKKGEYVAFQTTYFSMQSFLLHFDYASNTIRRGRSYSYNTLICAKLGKKSFLAIVYFWFYDCRYSIFDVSGNDRWWPNDFQVENQYSQ